jgi:hypothetical protein
MMRIRTRTRIQHLRLNTGTDPDPIRIHGFEDQKLKKISKLHKKPSALKRENMQRFKKMKFLWRAAPSNKV